MNQDNRKLAATSDWDADDVAILSALKDVALPAGAAERLRCRLASPQPATTELAEPVLVATGRRTRRVLLSLAAAAAIASIAFFFRAQPISREQLAAHCIEQLELISDSAPQWESATVRQAANDLEPLLISVNGKLQLVGVKQQVAGRIAESCRVWKFLTEDGKGMYVFEFQSAGPVQEVSERLGSVSRASGGWSLAALRHGDQLLVAAVHGDIKRYFNSVPLA